MDDPKEQQRIPIDDDWKDELPQLTAEDLPEFVHLAEKFKNELASEDSSH